MTDVSVKLNADPREATCRRQNSKDSHLWRDGCFYPDGKTRCVNCGRIRGKRYPKVTA